MPSLLEAGHRRLPRRARAQEPAALHHLRQRRRRQVDADRAAAARLAADLRGPARGARGGLAADRHAGRGDRLRAAARRPRGRARAGDHDRRRLPLLLDRAAQVHRRRHAGPRAVHAQHGHRRLDRRLRGDPDRRPQGRPHPDAPPHLPRLAARHPPRRGRGQQDGPRRLLAGGVRRRSSATTATSRAGSGSRRRPASRSRRCAATTSPARAASGCPGTRGRRCSSTSRRSRSTPSAPSAGRSGCPSSGSTGRTSTSAASPARSPAARSRRATASSCSRRGGRAPSSGS